MNGVSDLVASRIRVCKGCRAWWSSSGMDIEGLLMAVDWEALRGLRARRGLGLGFREEVDRRREREW